MGEVPPQTFPLSDVRALSHRSRAVPPPGSSQGIVTSPADLMAPIGLQGFGDLLVAYRALDPIWFFRRLASGRSERTNGLVDCRIVGRREIYLSLAAKRGLPQASLVRVGRVDYNPVGRWSQRVLPGPSCAAPGAKPLEVRQAHPVIDYSSKTTTPRAQGPAMGASLTGFDSVRDGRGCGKHVRWSWYRWFHRTGRRPVVDYLDQRVRLLHRRVVDG